LRFAKEAEDKNVDLLLFPECFLTGYILSEAFAAEHSYDFESEQFSRILKRLENIVPVLVLGVNEKRRGNTSTLLLLLIKAKLSGPIGKII
jgi:predicted amidohydrolase